MIALINGLPRDALVRTPVAERGRDPWTAELELMAQLIEIVSIDVAGMRLRKPIKVPRPKKNAEAKATARRAASAARQTEENPYRAAIRMFGGSQPASARERQAAQPARDEQPEAARPDPSYRAAIRVLQAHQPARLRLVRDEETGEA